MNDFKRNCPLCNVELTYSTKGNYEQAYLKNSPCMACAQREMERWNAGKTKHDDPKVAALAESVKRAMNEPGLRSRLDEGKKLPREEILKRVEGSGSTWNLVSSVDDYTRQTDRNLLFRCKVCSHEELKSVGDILAKCRCKKCNLIKGKGSRNPAFVPLEKFLLQLAEKHGLERFKFDPDSYGGKYSPMDWECTVCSHRFSKQPRAFLQEKIGCPKCARKSTSEKQSRTKEEFYEIVKKIHGNKFSYFPVEDQEWKNDAQIKWKCNDCGKENIQNIGSHFDGGCSVCSLKFKHDSRSFILKSIKIWGPDSFDYSNVFYTGNKEHVELKCKKCDHLFLVTPANHWIRGCHRCAKNRFVSIGETEWLNSLGISPSQRQYFITLPGGEIYNCDAVVGMTVYEYYGDYWHGNPKRFPPELINTYTGTTMSELYKATIDREELIRQAGYEVITMWESDWAEIRTCSA